MPSKKKTEPEMTIAPIPFDEPVPSLPEKPAKTPRTRKPADKHGEELKSLKAQLKEQTELAEQCRKTIDAKNNDLNEMGKEIRRLSELVQLKTAVIQNATSTLANLHQSILLATRKEG